MTTIRSLAAEHDMQPYELAALVDLGADVDENAELDADTERWMREALAVSATFQNPPLVQYRVEIDATNADGTIWQTMHVERIESDGTAIDLAENVAQNQSITEGDGWRVRVFLDEYDDEDLHVAEAGPGVDGIDLTELGNRILALSALSPIERALAAAELAGEAKSTLARTRRAAVYEATRRESWAVVAGKLGVSTAAVNQLVTQHRAS